MIEPSARTDNKPTGRSRAAFGFVNVEAPVDWLSSILQSKYFYLIIGISIPMVDYAHGFVRLCRPWSKDFTLCRDGELLFSRATLLGLAFSLAGSFLSGSLEGLKAVSPAIIVYVGVSLASMMVFGELLRHVLKFEHRCGFRFNFSRFLQDVGDAVQTMHVSGTPVTSANIIAVSANLRNLGLNERRKFNLTSIDCHNSRNLLLSTVILVCCFALVGVLFWLSGQTV